jgi:hypothetical protein
MPKAIDFTSISMRVPPGSREWSREPGPQRAKNGFGCPLRFPELARARPSIRCAPFKYSWCMGGIRCVTIYSFFGAEEMDFGPQRSPTSKHGFELEKRVLYAL